MKNKPLVRIFGTLIAASVLYFVTIFAIFVSDMMGLDELFGTFYYLIPVVSSILIFALIFLNIWKLFKKKARVVISISLAGAIGLSSIGVMGYVFYDWSLPIDTTEGEMPLYRYEPFAENTRAADLDSESTLKLAGKFPAFDDESMLILTEKLPILDGATALYPLYSSFARANYPVGDYDVYDIEYIEDTDRIIANSPVICQSTDSAFTSLINGDTDIAFLMGISKEQQERADALGVELTLTPIGREAFVFFVNKRNKIDGVSSEDIRRIYTGEMTNWKEAGGGNAVIRAYQRPEGSGSQTRLIEIMDGKQVVAPETEVYSSMMGMYEVVAGYKNYKNSLGYSFLYYIRDMAGENKIKFLTIDGVAPTVETIASGEYPFINDFYAVTVSNRSDLDPIKAENIEKFILWMQSEQGQSLVSKTGYVPLKNLE
ncbi:MAG: substrate-binding domain-containing protein [Ruminococcus sp.]|nr:substrate-binding domain-containing protein [Ruminococcus sp.]